jgi:zinc protease
MSISRTHVLLPALLATLLCCALAACSGRPGAPSSATVGASSPSDASGAPQAIPFNWYDGAWPHERASANDPALAPHDGAQFGRLPNGMRYLIVPNARPAGRVRLHFNVQAGSLMETDDQLGLAHFLEHMAFNGSRHFPPGALIPFLQQNGMSFGGDANAHTSYAETVYTLDLPAADGAVIDKGLLVMRDVADGMLLRPEEVDKERGVILAEKQDRDTEKSRSARARRNALYAGTRYANETIGSEAVIRAADSTRLRAFYDAWYRPERMVLVMVGDVAPATARAAVERAFADLVAHGPAVPMPDLGVPAHAGVTSSFDPADENGASVSVTAMHAPRALPDSPAVQRAQLMDALAQHAFQGRLLTRASAQASPLLGAHVAFANAFEMVETSTVAARCAPERWQDALTLVEQELRAALEGGFTDREFEDARKFYVARFEAMLRERDNRTSGDIAKEAVATLNADRVFQSTGQTCTLVLGLLGSATRADVEAAFRQRWATGNRLLHVAGAPSLRHLGDGAGQAIVEAWSRSAAAPARRSVADTSVTFPYLTEPDHAAPVASDQRANLAATKSVTLERRTVQLANGMALHLLPTPFEKGRFAATLLFGEGRRALSADDDRVARAAERALQEEALGRLSREAFRSQLAWRLNGVAERHEDDVCAIRVGGNTQEQDVAITALWTQFRDPMVTEAGRMRAMEALKAERKRATARVAMEASREFLYGGTRNLDVLDEADMAAVPLERMQAYLAATRAAGPRALVVVGDFDADAMVARAARLFADAAPVRPAPWSAPDVPFPHGRSRTEHAEDPAGSSVLVAAWRRDLPDETDRPALAVRRLLAAALNDALREEVRERLGAAYAPRGMYRHDTEFGGFGMYTATARTDAATIGTVREAVRRVADRLARGDVPKGTANRLRGPILTALSTAATSNQHWNGLLTQEARTGRPHLAWSEGFPALLRAVTDADLAREAARAFGTPGADLAVIGEPAAVTASVPSLSATSTTAPGVPATPGADATTEALR